MPGTLLPHEILTELTEMAGRILRGGPATRRQRRRRSATAKPAWAYIVEHSIDATVAGRAGGPPAARPRTSSASSATGLFLQDIGKLALPERLVQKPGPLDPGEWELMMQHPLLGLRVPARRLDPPAREVGGALAPRAVGRLRLSRAALIGEEIPLFARIAAVADVFDAVTSARYHAAAGAAPRGRRDRPRRLRHRIRPACGRGVPRRRSAASRAGRAPRRRSSRRRSRGGGRRPRGRPTGRSGSPRAE